MFDTLLLNINDQILNPLIFLLIALASMQFIWGLLKYVRESDNEEVRNDGKRHMIYGIIGMAIMLSALGIIELIAGSLGVDTPDL